MHKVLIRRNTTFLFLLLLMLQMFQIRLLNLLLFQVTLICIDLKKVSRVINLQLKKRYSHNPFVLINWIKLINLLISLSLSTVSFLNVEMLKILNLLLQWSSRSYSRWRDKVGTHVKRPCPRFNIWKDGCSGQSGRISGWDCAHDLLTKWQSRTNRMHTEITRLHRVCWQWRFPVRRGLKCFTESWLLSKFN